MPSMMRYVNIISRCGLLWRGEKLRGTGLKPGQAPYILTLCHTPGLSQEQIARRVYIDKSNVTRHLGALEREGFVERRQSEADRRVTLVYPTQKMLDLLPQVRQCIDEWHALIFDGLSAEELEQFDATLTKITQRAQEYVKSKDVIEG